MTENPEAALTVMRIISDTLARLTEKFEELQGRQQACTEAIDAKPE